MRAEQRKLARLRRLEKIRALAKQQAAQHAAEAEGTLAHLSALAARTRAMAEGYRDLSWIGDGQALRQQAQFTLGLAGITQATSRDAASAQATADHRQQDLATAERRRAAVEDRAVASERALAQRQSHGASAARRQIGTGLE
jgi:paraquat-inducible protein B